MHALLGLSYSQVMPPVQRAASSATNLRLVKAGPVRPVLGTTRVRDHDRFAFAECARCYRPIYTKGDGRSIRCSWYHVALPTHRICIQAEAEQAGKPGVRDLTY